MTIESNLNTVPHNEKRVNCLLSTSIFMLDRMLLKITEIPIFSSFQLKNPFKMESNRERDGSHK